MIGTPLSLQVVCQADLGEPRMLRLDGLKEAVAALGSATKGPYRIAVFLVISGRASATPKAGRQDRWAAMDSNTYLIGQDGEDDKV